MPAGDAVARGVERLRAALASGEWDERLRAAPEDAGSVRPMTAR